MKHIIVFALLLLALPAKAGFLIEPNLGYQISSTYDRGTPPTDSINGITYGVMAGYDYMGLQVLLDYMGSIETDIKPSTGTYVPAAKGSESQIGVVVGYQIPMLFRIFAGYIFTHEVTFKQTPFTVISKGSGFKVGASYSIIPMLNVNLTYVSSTFKDATVNGVSATYTTQPKFNELILSVSVPLTF